MAGHPRSAAARPDHAALRPSTSSLRRAHEVRDDVAEGECRHHHAEMGQQVAVVDETAVRNDVRGVVGPTRTHVGRHGDDLDVVDAVEPQGPQEQPSVLGSRLPGPRRTPTPDQPSGQQRVVAEVGVRGVAEELDPDDCAPHRVRLGDRTRGRGQPVLDRPVCAPGRVHPSRTGGGRHAGDVRRHTRPIEQRSGARSRGTGWRAPQAPSPIDVPGMVRACARLMRGQ